MYDKDAEQAARFYGETFPKAFSFQIATDDQAETDKYWNAIVNNGGGSFLADYAADADGSNGEGWG